MIPIVAWQKKVTKTDELLRRTMINEPHVNTLVDSEFTFILDVTKTTHVRR